ncbi:purine nucleoside permease [Flammeovirgaceae bacterium SG7u.111]|nr:purine nucleoside permease [Flammeovirgaceae bacterium SG7u.132]WPO36293.1 purine nucleoside permease [Flammeovirgaceae bacterium SG7u.111]
MTLRKAVLLTMILGLVAACQEKKVVEIPAKIPVKVVVISLFEQGEDEGDKPGEFQYWVERVPLAETIPFPQGNRNLRYNSEKQILGICAGIGTAKATASIMGLGMDPRFDLSKAYFIVAGISGVDPEDASTGSAAWAEWLVDGDLAHEIDAREIPEDWTTGYLPLRRKEPYELPARADNEGEAYRLDSGLVNWAFDLTKDIKLEDTGDIKKMREKYTEHPNAQKPPVVMKGDQLAAMTYWHGELMNDWANDWVNYWTEGQGNFVTSAMEDTGVMRALLYLGKAGKVDPQRYLVLRTASNFTMQYPGLTAAQSLAGEKLEGEVGYSAFIPSLEAAWKVGSKVVFELSDNWEKYENEIPHK